MDELHSVDFTLLTALRKRMKTESLYQVAKGSGVSYAVLHNLTTGKKPDVRLSTVTKLAAYLRLHLVPIDTIDPASAPAPASKHAPRKKRAKP